MFWKDTKPLFVGWIKIFKSLVLLDIFRPNVGLFFNFVEKSLKDLSKKSMKTVFFTIFFLGSNLASMVNQKNLLKVQYSFILILKKLPRFSKNIPIIKDNSRPAAFVPYIYQTYYSCRLWMVWWLEFSQIMNKIELSSLAGDYQVLGWPDWIFGWPCYAN